MILDSLWYGKKNPLKCCLALVLLPMSWCFALVSAARRTLYQSGMLHSSAPLVPVVVVGGITVGGSGKTPLCKALVHYLHEQGYQPGILSRGYKGHARQYPLEVEEQTPPAECGDEPLLLKRSLKQEAVVVVDPRRNRGAEFLVSKGVNVIVTDDGLQHYALQRDVEICVLDVERQLGNGHLLPLGPLRERSWRLETVDAVVCNGTGVVNTNYFAMQLLPEPPCSLEPGCSATLQRGTEVYALAGIGNPERFYHTAEGLGLKIVKKINVPDHGKLSTGELMRFSNVLPVVMTAKDAIKYQGEQLHNVFVINVNAVLNHFFYERVLSKIEGSANKISKRAEQRKQGSAPPDKAV